nr:polysaccharide lyase family 8 super-sandwich domain-containing protein [Photobacterium damselae]
MINTDYNNRTALIELNNRINNKNETNNSYFIGFRQYPLVDYAATIQSNYAITLRMASIRTEANESGNGEGLKSYYLGNGTLLCVSDKNEYKDIAPVWDWERLPGTTTQLGLYEDKFPSIDWGANSQGSSDFVGTVKNSNYCLSSMVLSKENIKDSYKSYIMSSDNIICIGNSINSDYIITTNVDQFLWDGSDIIITKSDSTKEIISKTSISYEGTDIEYISIGDRRYEFPGTNQNIKISLLEQSGSWYDINNGKDKTVLTKNVVSISIIHSKYNNYSYILYPSYEKSKQYQIEIKNNGIHYVKDNDGHIIISNRKSGSIVPLKNKANLYLTSTCLMLIKEESDGSLEISVSDPTQKLRNIIFSLDGHYDGTYAFYNANNNTTYVELPIDESEIFGKSYKMILNKLIP